ncbi:hypothetical protein BXZ70DRAFT_940895 [Cristinia sonorae]|uniref:Uncharacterized protein n=1 Tax=Cristinia sonorae TaxID=1940300 RepID=A0A8K0UN13_9AGAR|nr:hypothetical protein BXZ70DRAFT_940895 [Cristinia sonorae]
MVIPPPPPSFLSHSRGHGADSWYNLLGANPIALIVACFTLNTIGQAVIILLIATLLLSPNVRQRNATLVNLLVVTVICSVTPALLFYTNQYTNPHPPRGLCMLQAILKHGTDPMFVVASLALVIEFLQGTDLVVISMVTRKYMTSMRLICAPYATFVVFASVAAGLGGSHPQTVIHHRNELYCKVNMVVFSRIIEGFTLIVVAATISLEAYTIVKLRRTWYGVRRAKSSTLFTLSQTFRIAGFTVLQLNYIILSVIDFYFSSVGTHVVPIVYEALMPLGTFLIFGTAMDCLNVWMCWKRPSGPPTSDDKPPLPTARDPTTDTPSPVINVAFRLSLIPGYKTPSDFMTISDAPVPSTRRQTLQSTVSRGAAVKTPSILRNGGDGLSTASSGDQPPPSARRSMRWTLSSGNPARQSRSTNAPSELSRGDAGTLASSVVRVPSSPRAPPKAFIPPISTSSVISSPSPPSAYIPVPDAATRIPEPPPKSKPAVAVTPTTASIPVPPAPEQRGHCASFVLTLSLPPSGFSLDF